jgi:hypothetical protein
MPFAKVSKELGEGVKLSTTSLSFDKLRAPNSVKVKLFKVKV